MRQVGRNEMITNLLVLVLRLRRGLGSEKLGSLGLLNLGGL